jgi:uncharacterized membrane protein
MESRRIRAKLFVGLVFLCGALAGAVATNVWVRAHPFSIPLAQADSPRPNRQQRAVEWFTTELKLSPEQTQRLRQILDETRVAYQGHELEIERIRREGNSRVRDILNGNQKVKFDAMLAARRKDHEKRKHP